MNGNSPREWPKCPHCGSLKTIFPDSSQLECLECGEFTNCCPNEVCRTTKVRRTEDQKKLQCYICGTIGELPPVRQNTVVQFLNTLKGSDKEFLITLAERLAPRITELPTLDRYEIQHSGNVSELDYLREMNLFVKVPAIIDLKRKAARSKAAAFRSVKYFAENVLGENVHFRHPNDKIRLKRAAIVRTEFLNMLGFTKQDRTAARAAVIVEGYKHGLTQRQIAEELDSRGFLDDPFLAGWTVSSWVEAYDATESSYPAVKTLFSHTKTRKGRKK